MISQPEKLQRTPLKEDIEAAFKHTQMKATSLRNTINCRCPGNRDVLFRAFVGNFDYFFGLSNHKKELNEEIVKQCDKWFDLKNKYPSIENINYGLSLFKKYSKELFKQGVLIYG